MTWQDRNSYGLDIMRLRRTTGHEKRGYFQVSQSDCDDRDPSISGHVVVWQRACPRITGPSYRSISGYDLEQGVEFLVYDGEGQNAFPKVETNYVVWLAQYGDVRGGRGAVGIPTAQNLETGENWQLGAAREAISIGLSGGVAWWRRAGPTPMYDLETKGYRLHLVKAPRSSGRRRREHCLPRGTTRR